MFSSPMVRPESLWWEIGPLSMRYGSDESLEPLTNLSNRAFIRQFPTTLEPSLTAVCPITTARLFN